MAQGPCLNPNCPSNGIPHPNCRCYMATGGVVSPCDDSLCNSDIQGMDRTEVAHMAEGGQVPAGAIPIEQFKPAIQTEQGPLPPGAIPVSEFKSSEDKYGTPSEYAKTFIEGAASGLAGPVGTAALRGLGGVPEEMRARSEENPITYGAGQVAGLIGGGGVLLKTVASKIATKLPAQLAIENALFTAGDEVSKMIKEDPHTSVQSAVLHTGLSALMGAGTGKVVEIAARKTLPFVESLKAGINKRLSPNISGPDITRDILNKKRGVEESTAESLIDQMLRKAEEKGIGGFIGNKLGHMAEGLTGIPYLGKLGAYLGYKHLDKVLPTIGEKFLSSPTSVQGLKAALDTAESVLKGEALLSKASKAVFEAGSANIPSPKPEKLLKTLSESEGDPTKALIDPGHINDYMPDHGAAQGAVIGRAVSYLNSLKPKENKELPLSPARKPSKYEQSVFNQAVDIVEQPLTVFDKIKKGTLTPQDLLSVKTVYPDMYRNMQDKLTHAMIEHVDAGGHVPYKQALVLNMFLGTPLESSTLPYNVLMNQKPGLDQNLRNQPLNRQDNKGLSEAKSKGLQKLSQSTQTPSQARVNNKVSNNGR